MKKYSKKEMASYLDSTNLKPDATFEEIEKLCSDALKYQMKGVCVNPVYIPYVADRLADTKVLPIAVVGFPLGSNLSLAKAFEAKEAVTQGALEIDMVMNIGGLIDKKYDLVFEDIKAVVEASSQFPVKVILETCLLSHDQIAIATALAHAAGANFVKTSTGFSKKGATEEHVKLMRKIAPDSMGIKASGGIRSLEDASKMIEAGATRIGTSAAVEILKEISI
ncbi:MAG TPA: deoxyribose-phosphate aldolase [Chlamydiales bacterium]|nr:deoxyribose-phosphate aldolase [Chlamydiales bacterium]